MKPFFSQWFFNPNGLYKRAVLVREKIDNFRESIANYFGVAAQEVIFTSGGTESDNLAILGVVSHIQHTHPDSIPHIIVGSIEHSAVLETALFLEQTGSARVTYVPVNEVGVVDLEVLKKSLTPETVLVSVMMVNNEVGSIQPISDIVKSVRHFKKHTLGNPHALYPLVHTDASQAVLYQDFKNIQYALPIYMMVVNLLYHYIQHLLMFP
jgi:cysteine desulfurase